MEKPSATTGAAHNAGEEEPVEHWWRKYQERRSARQQERSSGKSDDPPVIRPTVCAAPWSFVCRGTAQGQRDHRPLPHRFARPPVRTNRRTHKVGPPVHQSVFSFGPAAARKVNCPKGARDAPLESPLFDAVKKRMEADPRRDPAFNAWASSPGAASPLSSKRASEEAAPPAISPPAPRAGADAASRSPGTGRRARSTEG